MTLNRQKKTVTKELQVYLPKNYTPTKQYNIMYLCHGEGGHNYTYLGTSSNPRPFKSVLDSNINNTIFVTPTITYTSSNRENCLNDYSDELANVVIPTVERKYSTYNDREHRIIGGFSLGAITTWRMFAYHQDVAKYYIPMSCTMYYEIKKVNKTKEAQTNTLLIQSAQNNPDFKIYVASGSNDGFRTQTKSQVNSLLQSEPFTNDNLSYHETKGNKHSYTNSYYYIINGLKSFGFN